MTHVQRAWGFGVTHARRVDVAVLRVLAEDRTPSASIAIVRDGGLAYAAAYGRARLSPPAPATPDTRYQLASLSKTLTAEALLWLEQEGKLSLDDPVYADSLRPLGEPDSFELRSEDEADGLTTRVYEVSARGRRLRVTEQILADGRIETFQVQAAD